MISRRVGTLDEERAIEEEAGTPVSTRF